MLREWREYRQLTQRELADRSGVHHITISRLENGVSRANPSTVRKLAAALDCGPLQLMGRPEPGSKEEG